MQNLINEKANSIMGKHIKKGIKNVANPNNNNVVNMLDLWFNSEKCQDEIVYELKNYWKPCCDEQGCDYFVIEVRKIYAKIGELINQMKGIN